MRRAVLVFLSFSVGVGWGQLVQGQKQADFQNLASLYAKRYGPTQWKLQLFNYNLLNISPWLNQIQQTTDDLGFYEIMGEYVASLNDAHSVYQNPSDFTADLHFSCDIYDGKVLIDSIDRTTLPASKYPFQVGDEVVMVDNRTPDDYIKDFSRFFSDANPVSTSRDAAGLIPFRVQALEPRAEAVGATATVVIRRQKGDLETFVIPWDKSGTPLTQIGKSPLPQRAGQQPRNTTQNPHPKPGDYRVPLRYLQKMVLPVKKAVLNFDTLPPVFNLPAGFTQRLGNGATDFYFTGTYQSGGKNIGFIRIPDFLAMGDFNNVLDAETSFDSEIAFMQQNTDGLVIDVMRNPGGFVCYAEDLVSRLVNHNFYDVNYELRAILSDVQSYQQAVLDAENFGEPNYVVQILQQQTRIVSRAYQQDTLTSAISVCSVGSTRPPNKDSSGKLAIYTKPIIVLADQFSASAAETFTAMFQDAKAGKLFGARTLGAGGIVIDGNSTGYYSEGTASIAVALVTRQHPVVTSDYPTAPLIENIGVRPDVENEYMTKSNLLNGGSDFVKAFTAQILSMIK